MEFQLSIDVFIRVTLYHNDCNTLDLIEEKNKFIEQKNKQKEIDDNKYIREELLNSQQSTSAQAVEDQNHKREARASKHQSWEQKHSRSLREANVVSSRAHSILRTSSDSEHTSSFGMVDTDILDKRESLRLANINQSREQRLAIKKNIQEDIHNSSQNRAQTFSDVYRSIDINFDNLDD